MDYPTLPTINIQESVSKPMYKVSFETGYQQQRPKHTRAVRSLELTHNLLTQSEAETLKDFFIDNQGYVFTYTHPITSYVYTVTFDMDSLDFEFSEQSATRQNATVKLKEV